MDKDWDELLEDGLLQVPSGFTESVLRRLGPAPRPARRRSLAQRLKELALIGGGIVGLAQLAAFMFGLWAASSAA